MLFEHFSCFLTRIIYFSREANEGLVEIKTSNFVFSNRVYRFCSRFRVYDIISDFYRSIDEAIDTKSISISIKAPMRFTRIRPCFPSVCRDAIAISDAGKLQFRDRWNNFRGGVYACSHRSKGRIPRFVSYTLHVSRHA